MKQYLNQIKDWYLQKWADHKKPMIMIHVFVGLVILGEIWGALT